MKGTMKKFREQSGDNLKEGAPKFKRQSANSKI